MLFQQFFDQAMQLGIPPSQRKNVRFLGSKVILDLLLHMLLDLRLPRLQLLCSRQGGTMDAHAQRQSVLMLPRERHKIWVAEHMLAILPWRIPPSVPRRACHDFD